MISERLILNQTYALLSTKFTHLLLLLQIIRNAFKQEKSIQTKDGMADLVTETDQLVEKTIIGSLKEKYPTHR